MPILALIASLGELDGHRAIVDQHLALVRLNQPVQDVHQCALARAVLAEQGADLTWLDHQVDVIVGDQVTEALGDATQLKLQPAASPSLTPASGLAQAGPLTGESAF